MPELAGRPERDEEPLLRYVLDAKPVHDHLSRALMLLSGFALMRLTSRQTSGIDWSSVQTAGELVVGAHDHFGRLRVPEAASHHHHHLSGAESALRCALAATSSATDASDQVYRALAEAVRHLRATNRLLPGFEAVDLAQSCCAAHGRAAGSTPLLS